MSEPTETNQTDLMDRATFGGGEHFSDMAEEVETVSETPEPETVSAETEEVEAAPEADVEESEETAEASEEATEEEVEGGNDENWLPDEQAKRFPLETLVEFSNRRKTGYTEDEIKADPRLQRILSDKLNTDIYAAQLERERQANQGTEEETNPFADVTAEVAPKTETTQTVTEPQAAHYQRVDQIVAQLPKEALQKWGETILKRQYGDGADVQVLEKALANPNLTPEQRVEAQQALQVVRNAGAMAQEQARGVVDILATVVPQMLPELLEQIYPGSREQAQRQTELRDASAAWEAVRSTQKDGKPLYSNLPEWGTPELKGLLAKADQMLGWPEGALASMQFKDAKGNPLPYRQNVEMAYRAVARALSGQKPAPVPVKTLQQATETGKRLAKETQQKRAQGRAMGSGTSSRGFEKPSEKNDPLMQVILEDQEAESSPFSNSSHIR